ncbi:hypothetical protein NDU88_003598 [Pleurodeles waltl]|uniref:Uncharacterized protein n=1 Tax=Pleurodeles waltl TaxID=8319 RepID=A0AAV7QDI9_PLEWA|nr:hypothetical protein NDU88_003598 [Pleurodeles waltl]
MKSWFKAAVQKCQKRQNASGAEVVMSRKVSERRKGGSCASWKVPDGVGRLAGGIPLMYHPHRLPSPDPFLPYNPLPWSCRSLLGNVPPLLLAQDEMRDRGKTTPLGPKMAMSVAYPLDASKQSLTRGGKKT